ncbi:uncharacterized protein LOC109599934 [Aethina tumida]|uniref:uncharacterized protein LOC109599934 n=1 Tax=Aethina tumida TaxID=116153 RepID=UPI00214765B6|nr:uncharacterized protein LOC109599934 [Aethina tumida]
MFKALSYFLLVASVCGVQFDIANRDDGEIWIGIQSNSNKPSLESGGFKLEFGETRSVYAPDNWAGKFWSRQWCDISTGQCLVGNCNGVECHGRSGNPPVTLVEITLRGSGNQDFYDISLVKGFSTLATIRPIDGQGHCKAIECKSRINYICPNELKFNTPQGVLGCMSSCMNHEYSAKFFKEHCPDAYTYAYNDPSSIFTCKADLYEITFGG